VPWNSGPLDHGLAMYSMNQLQGREDRESLLDQLCYDEAWKSIKQQPGNFIRACVYRVTQLWSPLPHKLAADESTGRRLLRYATCAWYCGVYALAIVGIWRLRWKLLQPPWVWGVLLCLAFTAVHTFYWTNLRMRAPLMPFVAIVSAAIIAGRRSDKPPSCLDSGDRATS